MSARATASATVSFGLVAIPVKLYTTTETAAAIRFNMLHENCGSRIRQQLYCPKDEEVVPRDDTVRGYEFAKDQYVTFTEDEIKAIEEEASHSIDIAEFVPLDKVDPVYFEKPYYLGPDKGGARPYQLLREALLATGLAAVARYAARGKQYLTLIRPVEDGLVLEQLRYANELRAFSEVPIDAAEVKSAELEMAIELVKQHATDEFKPEGYEDAVRLRLEEIIQRKIDGLEVTTAPAGEPQAQIIDLMEALKASLSETELKGARKPAAAAQREAEPSEPAHKKAARKAAKR